MSDLPPRSLVVSREALTLVSKQLKRSTTDKPLKLAQLVIRFDDGRLVLDIPGASVAVPATGHWPGLLRAPGIIILLLAKGEPPENPVEFRVDDSFLYICAGSAKLKFAAYWEDISPPRIEVSLDASDRDILQLALQFPRTQIVSSGLEKRVFHAERRFQVAVDQAHAAIKSYRIPRLELESVLRSLVVKRTD